MTAFIPTNLGVVVMDYEDRLKFPGRVYAYPGERKINVYLYHEGKLHHGHRLILGVSRRDLVVDHKNGNRFDWRKKNLRTVKVSTNNKNKSDYRKKTDLPRGVRRRGDKFVAVISVNKKQIYLGTFSDAESAENAFVEAHVEAHGKNSFYSVRGV
jgi:hypothetical protein